jgi:hypothetical protein
MKLSQKADQVLQRAAEPINRPSHDDIEPAPAGVFPKLIKLLAVIADANDARVPEVARQAFRRATSGPTPRGPSRTMTTFGMPSRPDPH